jgi:hypothetical protein
MIALDLDYTELTLVSMACEERERANRECAENLAADPADRQRFAGAIKNMTTMADWYLEIRRKADAARLAPVEPPASYQLTRLSHCTPIWGGHSPACDRDGTYCSLASTHRGACKPHGTPA